MKKKISPSLVKMLPLLETIDYIRFGMINSTLFLRQVCYKDSSGNRMDEYIIFKQISDFIEKHDFFKGVDLSIVSDIYLSGGYRSFYFFYEYDIRSLQKINNCVSEDMYYIVYLASPQDKQTIYLNLNVEGSRLLDMTNYLFSVIDEQINILTVLPKNVDLFLKEYSLPPTTKLLLISVSGSRVELLESSHAELLCSAKKIKKIIKDKTHEK